MIRLNSNQILALIIGLTAIAYTVLAFQIPGFPLPRPVDSDLFPKILGVSLLVLAGFLFFERPAEPEVDEQSGESGPGEFHPWWQAPRLQVAVTTVALLAYALTLEWLGFVLASTILCAGLTLYYGFRRHLVNLAASLGVVLTLYVLMTRLMGVHLPRGLLPF